MIFFDSPNYANAQERNVSFLIKEVFDDCSFITDDNINVTLAEIQLHDYYANKCINKLKQQQNIELNTKSNPSILNNHLESMVYIGGANTLQAWLIDKGYAYYYPMNRKYNENLATLEQQARSREIGVWSSTHYVKNNAIKVPYKQRFIVIKGVVKDVYKGKQGIYFNFGADWKVDTTAFINKKHLPYRYDYKQWNGKEVTVKGWLRYYNGPFVEFFSTHHITQ